ncbi:FKBP-type peptidylprolyl isomerase [Serratia fonticola]|uniref:FKBP-type peptidyl-prolyl cis-trans isomerase N-terminal domain-containing protein n=1 Tax=Serratia fonticola TaxID=47917 RepID=UPI000412397D|nr:FKBP-type peptidyl-prolyl cis-trans isomerase N-terminal domain-containing protein [Serratia fonticola]AKG68304.1 FKBP-type peptidylprolyl isomerase [Serratia fonticola]CAI1531234.1 FKBP-type peptidyl-prolyl cis-trans isomerase fkpA precursor [Serratia fonticola]
MRLKKWRLPTHYTALAALVLAGSVSADDGVPAILQFAEQYRQQVSEKPAPPEKTSTSKAVNTTKKTVHPVRRSDEQPSKAANVNTGTPHQLLLASKQQLAHQRLELEALRQELNALRAEKTAVPVVAPPAHPDLTPLKHWVATLGDAWRGSPDAQRTAALLREAKQQTAQAHNATVQANEQVRILKEAVLKTEGIQARRLRETQDTVQTLRTTLKEAEQKQAELQASANQAQTELTALRQRTSWNMTPAQLTQEKTRLSYAAGSTLGQDIQTMIAERQEWGVPVDKIALLAGVVDSVSGHLQLPQEQLTQLVAKADATANAARDKRHQAQSLQDDVYLARFKKQKGATQSPSGFWYRIDYAGDSALAKEAIIDVVVKETLTDNTVIQDMELNGKVLSQPLAAFPPLFREAIGYLRNHGSLTLVVPPALAYGETGYPPKVPPNATMVYTLRIDNSHVPE